MKEEKRVTIYEIAERAGVSAATVSRALNSDYPVSSETRARIDKAVKDLNYRTNFIARSLRSRKSNLIAIVIPDITNAFFMEAAKGLEKEISTSGYNLVLSCTDGKAEKEHKIIDSLVERRVDGLIVASSDTNGKYLESIAREGTPIVLIDRPLQDCNLTKIIWDNKEGAKKITNYLISYGHKNIGIVNVSLDNINGRDRYQGFLEAIADAGLENNPEWNSPSDSTSDGAYKWAMNLMSKPKSERPTALFAANNVKLAGVLKACLELGIKIGDELSLVSFGFSDFLFGPEITSLFQDSLYMGKLGGERILSMLNGNKQSNGQDIILIPELHEGVSVKDLRNEKQW